jgi:hypothetical protein
VKRILAAAVAGIVMTVPLSLAVAAPAAAAPKNAGPKNAGAACAQAGISFLRDNNLLQAAASRQIDYSLLGPDAEGSPFQGLIVPQLDEGSFLPLGQVVKLHIQRPELFPNWC